MLANDAISKIWKKKKEKKEKKALIIKHKYASD
jgi:hypothetical protein